MVQYGLIDTGYKSSARLGTRLSGANIINSGSVLSPIDISSFRINDKSTVENTPLTASTDSVEANYVSVENRKYIITIKLKKSVAAERTIFKHIVGVPGSSTYPGITRTKGVKALYANGTSTRIPFSLELHGRTDTNFHGNEIPTDNPAIIGYVTSISVDDTPSGDMFTITLNFTETA